MNPIQLTENLQETLVNYLTTIFNVNRDGQEPELASAIETSLRASGALFNGPYLEISPPYKRGKSLNDLINERVLSTRLGALPCFRDNRPIPLGAGLYTHQEAAVHKLASQVRSVVVSSGTGSGKTESFLIPILNDLLVDPTDGVRAVLIYPLNALVNDQLDRLRTLLKGTGITFGRYTSELAETTDEAKASPEGRLFIDEEVISRQQIRRGEKLPKILITNYAMLEYLLFRPEDSILFQSGAWRFLVLDEAHTYTGAQGIEIAMLIRRLKHRLDKQPGEMQCIATSATLTDKDADKAAEFASLLFGEAIESTDVIFGQVDEDYFRTTTPTYQVDPDVYLREGWDQFLESVRQQEIPDAETAALHMHNLGLLPEHGLDLAATHPQEFLYQALLRNPHLTELREWMLARRDDPAVVQEAAHHLFDGHIQDEDAQLQALYHLIELGALARPADDKPSLLPTRYHLFVRPPQGIWLCLNPECTGRTSPQGDGWSRMFTTASETCDACGCRVYPAVVCRECGQVYVKMLEQAQEYVSPPLERYVDGSPVYFTWKLLQTDAALGNTDDESSEAQPEETTLTTGTLSQQEVKVCLRCGRKAGLCTCKRSQHTPVHVPLYLVRETRRNKKNDPLTLAVEELQQCPRCFSKSQPNTEIVTPVNVGGITPLSILTYDLYRHLPVSSKEDQRKQPGEGRKLLTFYDNRQGAARFAAFLQDVVNTQNYRHVIKQAIAAYESKEGYAPSFGCQKHMLMVESIPSIP